MGALSSRGVEGGSSRAEAGFTIVEVLVAALVLVLGTLATFTVLQAATRNTERAKATQVALDRAQQELEALRSLSYSQLVMSATPPPSSDSLYPDSRVSGGSFALSRDGSNLATMVVQGGSLYAGGSLCDANHPCSSTIDPGPIPFTSGSVTGKIYRYVVWRNDSTCSLCQGGQDFKQIIVAVKLDNQGGGQRGYVEVQSDFIDPKASALTEPTPGSTGVVTGQQFYLSDTSCNPNANGSTTKTQRQDITGDHPLHNTLGTCASGPQTGSVAGAPDALLLSGAPDPSPADPSDPPLFDYSNDFYLEPNPATDKGVQIRREDAAGCNYAPTGGANPESQIHRWVSDPMPSAFAMTGRITLEFYTRAINSSGRVCVYLFTRSEAGTPPTAVDTRLLNAGGSNVFGGATVPTNAWFGWPTSGSTWPTCSSQCTDLNWTQERLTMTFPAITIPVGQRLGVALSVDRAVTTDDMLPFVFDNPNYKSRLEVDTTTPLEGG